MEQWLTQVTCIKPRGMSNLPCKVMAHSHKYPISHRSETVSFCMSNISNKWSFSSKHIPYISVDWKPSVQACLTSQINCYCTQNVCPIYPWFRSHWFVDVKWPKYNDIALQAQTLYTLRSENIGSHMSKISNKMILHSEHIPYIPSGQKPSVHTCQRSQIKWYCTPSTYPIYHYIRNCQFAHVKHPK